MQIISLGEGHEIRTGHSILRVVISWLCINLWLNESSVKSHTRKSHESHILSRLSPLSCVSPLSYLSHQANPPHQRCGPTSQRRNSRPFLPAISHLGRQQHAAPQSVRSFSVLSLAHPTLRSVGPTCQRASSASISRTPAIPVIAFYQHTPATPSATCGKSIPINQTHSDTCPLSA
ncbi:hypothetical protein L484_026882 [Morus notabilis]|uniref:Uncharacterized protein n=1 Tax=Morus notabilis TaxID=981085 RepID=W9RUN0_9ROSA|nr:hypothetical protein L484_026882 [Morus notabilis]